MCCSKVTTATTQGDTNKALERRMKVVGRRREGGAKFGGMGREGGKGQRCSNL